MRTQHFLFGHTGAPEDVIVARVRSTSFISALPADKQAQIDAQLRALIAAQPMLNGRETIAVPYVIHGYDVARSPRDAATANPDTPDNPRNR